jgi:VCBS repeat-containing protein
VTEDVAVVANRISTSGALTISDPDAGQSSFTAQAGTAGNHGYGTFTLAANGAWTYSADNTLAAIQNLNTGQTLTDSFTAVSSDGSANQAVTVTIHGTTDNHAPTGLIFVAQASTDGMSGTIGHFAATDADGDALTFSSVSNPTGFTVDGTTGVLGFPAGSSVASASLAVTATDTHGASTSQTFNVWVGANSGSDTTTLGGTDPNIASGRGQADTITGSSITDYIFGGQANDILTGKGGADWLSGGNGDDKFVYTALSDSAPGSSDTIADFTAHANGSTHDQIDVSLIDSGAVGGAFTFNGTTATAHGIWYTLSGGNTILHFDTDGVTGTDEMTITVLGAPALDGTDFIL